jgi:anti-anti-sigma factor
VYSKKYSNWIEGDTMHFRIEREGDISLIHPVGKFDGGRDCERLQTLVTELAESGCIKVVFSFSLTRWINSCGVGKLIAAKFILDEYEGRIVLCDLNERNMSIINTLRLDQIFEIHGSLKESVAILKHDSLTSTGS